MINRLSVCGYLSTHIEWSRQPDGRKECSFTIFERKRKDTDPYNIIYLIPVRCFSPVVHQHLALGVEKGDLLFVEGRISTRITDAEAPKTGKEYRSFVEALAVYNLTKSMESHLGGATHEKQRAHIAEREAALSREAGESIWGISIF